MAVTDGNTFEYMSVFVKELPREQFCSVVSDFEPALKRVYK